MLFTSAINPNSTLSANKARLYILEDDVLLRSTLVDYVEDVCPEFFEISLFDSLSRCLVEHLEQPCDLIISDLTVSDSGPSRVLRALRNQFLPNSLVLIYSGDLAILRSIEAAPNLGLYKKGLEFNLLGERIEQYVDSMKP